MVSSPSKVQVYFSYYLITHMNMIQRVASGRQIGGNLEGVQSACGYIIHSSELCLSFPITISIAVAHVP